MRNLLIITGAALSAVILNIFTIIHNRKKRRQHLQWVKGLRPGDEVIYTESMQRYSVICNSYVTEGYIWIGAYEGRLITTAFIVRPFKLLPADQTG